MRSRVYVTVGCPPVYPFYGQQQQRAAGLLLSAMRAGDIDRQLRAPCSRRRRSAARAGSVTLTAEGGGWTQILFAMRWLCMVLGQLTPVSIGSTCVESLHFKMERGVVVVSVWCSWSLDEGWHLSATTDMRLT